MPDVQKLFIFTSKKIVAHKSSFKQMLALVASAALLLTPLMSLSVRSKDMLNTKSRTGAESFKPASPVSPVVPSITATKTDMQVVDNDNDNNVDTGDTIKYTVTITNNGSTDATGVTFNDTLDANTTFVPGTLTTTPIAVNDTYAASGNIQISITAANGVLANDNDADGNSLTASSVATSSQGGNVSMNADGSFTYNPPPGFEGTDDFAYTITDGTSSSSAVVTINVSGMIWFIDNTAGAGGDGRLTSPFNALTGAGSFDAVAADDPGDNIFLYTGSGPYNGGLTLLAGQKLIGQGASPTLSAITGVTPPPGSLALPSTGGASPSIVSTSNAVNLGTNNLVRGLDIGNKTGAGLSGSGFGTLTVREVAIGGTGQALSLSSGTLDTFFNSLSSTNSSASGISLSSVGGTLSSGSTDVDNSSGAGIVVGLSSANLDFGATNVTASGGTGVNLAGSSGNMTFAALNITPDAGQRGLLATLNNTGTITSTSGTINTPNAVAVEIGGLSPASRTNLNMTLTSVSASNTSGGIALSNTSGSFTVTGDGATAGSGGTIQNITARGASFIDSTNISLSFMNLNNVGTVNGADPTVAASTCGDLTAGSNTGCNAGIHLVNVTGAAFANLSLNTGIQQGINGNNVSNFSLSNSEVINFGDQVRENGIQFKNLLGTSTISNTTLDSNEADQLLVNNSSGLLTSLTVSNSTFKNSVSPNGNSGISFNANTTANASIIVQTSTFSGNRSDGFFSNASGNATMSVNISGSTIQNNGNAGIQVVGGGASNSTFNISNNPVIKGMVGNDININLANPSTGTLQGTIDNNSIGTSGVPSSGSVAGSGINVISNGSGALTVAVTNNTIHGIQSSSGINMQARDGSNSLNATITGNFINTNSAGSLNGIIVQSGNGGTDTTSVCADIGGAGALANNIQNTAGGDEIRVRNRFPSTTFRLPGFAGPGNSTAAVVTYLAGRNNVNGGTITATINANIFGGGAACVAPSAFLRSGSEKTQYLASARTDKAEPRATVALASTRTSLKQQDARTSSVKSFSHAATATNGKQAESTPAKKLSSAPRMASMPVVSTINLNLGTLPAGKSVTITFNAMVNNSVPPGTTQVSNQGIVSGTNFANVLTDDPDVGGTADPTVTPIQAEVAPTISCPADITVNADSGTCTKSVSFNVTATGQPDPTVQCKIGATVITSPHTFPVGTTTVSCTASNGVPPDASCSFDVTVNDVEAPVITLNGANPMTVECHTSFTDPGATANDLCSGSVPVTSSGTVDADTPGTYTITYSATDGTNTATATRTVNVVDTTAPVITVNGANPMTVECHTGFSDPGATALDACSGSVPVTSSGTVDPNTPGTYTITYSATDGTNTATATRTVNVVDTTAPVITVNGANPMTVECHTSFSDPGATATDSCAGSVAVTSSGTVNANVPGTYTITYSATDGYNTTTATRTVNVVDTTPPVITVNGASSVTVECHTSYSDAGASATDSCAGSLAVTTTSNVNVNVPGNYTVTYTATDGYNTTTATRAVHVVDTIAPVITLNGPNPQTVECHTTYTDPGATATDSCAGNLPVSSASNVNPNVPGTYTVTYTATDGYNSSTKTRTVIVVDTGLPTITLNGQTIELWPPNHKYQTVTVANLVASASDGCDGTIDINDVVISKVTSDELENSGGDGNTLNDIVIAANCKSVQLRSERDGGGDGRVYTITFRVKDANGNVATKTAKVTVPKSQGNNGTAVDSGVHYTVNGTCP